MKNTSSSPNELSITVPISLPSAGRMEEIYREACLATAVKRAAWLDFAEAAEYLRLSPRTFMRRRKTWGLPIAELSPGLKIVFRADLDALALSKLVKGRSRNVIEFPSIVAHEELKKGAAA